MTLTYSPLLYPIFPAVPPSPPLPPPKPPVPSSSPSLSSHRTCFHGDNSPGAHLNHLTLPALGAEILLTDTMSSLRSGRTAYTPFRPHSVMESGFSEVQDEVLAERKRGLKKEGPFDTASSSCGLWDGKVLTQGHL